MYMYKMVYLLLVLLLVSSRPTDGQYGVGLFSESLNATVSNMTMFAESQIGNVGRAVQCRTNDTTQNAHDIGEWIDSNGQRVPSSFQALYALRQPGLVKLYRGTSISDNQQGVYTCRVPDSNGRMYTLYIGLYTDAQYDDGKPGFVSSPTFNLLTPYSHFPPSFTITCSSTMFPPTLVNWTRDNEPIDTTGDRSFLTSQILVDSMTTTFSNVLHVNGNDIQEDDEDVLDSIAGNYSCYIINKKNMNANSYVVTVPSGPPENITVSFLGSGNVRFSWDPPDGPIYGYQLFYQQVNGSLVGVQSSANITGPSINHTLLGLEAAATYEIQMLAYADLPTTLSDPISVTLNVAGIPQNISVTPSSSTSLSVKWSAPAGAESNVVEYIIDYIPTNISSNCPDGPTAGSLRISSSSRNGTVSGLQEDTQYSVSMRTVSAAAIGDSSLAVTERTLTDAPDGPPLNVTIATTNPSTVNLTWSPPDCMYRNGPITGYRIYLGNVGLGTTPRLRITLTTEMSLVQTFTKMNFTIAAINDKGESLNKSSPVYGSLIDVPGAVQSLSQMEADITSITISWSPPSGIQPEFYSLLNYTITWSLNNNEIGRKTVSTTHYEIEQLLPNTSYVINVEAMSPYRDSSMAVMEGITLKSNILGRVSGVNVMQAGLASVNISWSPLASKDVIFYKVTYNTTIEERTFNTTTVEYSINGLDNSLSYMFYVVAVVNGSAGGTIDGPPSLVMTFTFDLPNNLDIILIAVFTAIGGLLILIVIITITVIILTLLNRSIGPRLANKGEEGFMLIPIFEPDLYLSSPSRGRPSLVESHPTDVHAIEGQEVVLQAHFHGDPAPRLSWKRNDADIDWEKVRFFQREGTLIFPYVETKHSGAYEVTASNDHGDERVKIDLTVYPETEFTRGTFSGDTLTSVPVELAEFGQYITNLHLNSNKKFKEQFRRLTYPKGTTEVGEQEDNHIYNRNQKIIVFDNNRILLEPLPQFLDCQHNYINASPIVGEGQNARRFVATQGPLDRTIIDFWRLIWQEKACAIVMLTRLQEDFRIKCSRYWPDKSGTEDYGPFTITVINETSHQNYIIREMAVHYNSLMNNMRSKLVNPTGKINSKKSKYYSPAESRLIVYQYQYIDWVEHGSPTNTSSLISFHQSILEGTHNKDGPIVVHCSNGVGRTGAYIAIDMAIEQAKNQNVIDIPAIVSDIRQQRMMMIQSIEQYMTVHDAVMEHVLCGVTEISGLDLRKHMHSLSLKKEDCYDQDGLTTGFESQFKSLEQICVLPKDATCTVGKQNPRKNRNNEILPNDQWRVPLKNELPDYVNASFVPSYKNDRAFIIAQSPMKETRRDFWKIIFDQEITAIVMLCPIMEKNEEVCSQYWPSEGNVEFGEFSISVQEEWSHEGFSRKLLLVRNLKTNSLRKLAQFQVDEWNPDSSIASCNLVPIINIVNLVSAIQRKNTQIPVLVHCSNSIGRSSIFCATMATVEQLKSEGVVDIFKVVKEMRAQLPGAIQSKDQYQMIHSLTALFIEMFSTSANFNT